MREPFAVAAAIVRFVILNWPDTAFGLALRRRYMRARVASLGRDFKMHRGGDINGHHLIRIGDNSGFGENVFLALGPGPHEFRMGNNSCLGGGSYVRNMNHRFDVAGAPIDPTKPSYLQQGYEGTDIIIGDDVWVGARCVLLAGTKIGDHSIVAAGSVVSTEIPPYSIAAGNPVRVVRKRTIG